MWGQRGGWERRARPGVQGSFPGRQGSAATGLCARVSLAGSHERNSLEGAVGSRVSPQTSVCWQPQLELESLQV